ncbi:MULTISPECIES: porin [unclassified Thioalkalivibrio]|uniref:porin n=1 Tax=unclassified Thioalkalivibrio TaxID=2621013 RepID=UPI00036A8383|nr:MULTISPECIES: porin [unclassified Thioalkalivibrio]
MKKQILAVAVAGAFAVPAFAAADSNVTLFGQLQTQIVHHSGGNDNFDNGFRMHDAGGAGWIADGNGPNRLGVMVNHDLGNGLTALAKIEQDAQTTSGLNSSARDVYVGLDGNFGRVTIGRQNLPYSTAGKDPLNGTFMQARGNGVRLGTADSLTGSGGAMDPGAGNGRTNIGGLGNGSYEDRVIKYGNSFGMVGLQVAIAQNNGDGSGEQAISGRLNFDLGAVDLYVAHTNADDYRIDGADFRASKIGADWKSGAFRVVGEIEDYKFENMAGNTERDAIGGFVSGVYTMGRNDFVLTLGHTRNSETSAGAGDDGNVDYVALAVKHNFSNRVMAFAGVNYADYDGNVPFARPGTNNISAGGDSFTGVGAGMRVSF